MVMTTLIPYAIINSDGICCNRILWDGVSDWQPPKDCTAIPDPDVLYPIHQEPQSQSTDPLATLTPEQRQALLQILQAGS